MPHIDAQQHAALSERGAAMVNYLNESTKKSRANAVSSWKRHVATLPDEMRPRHELVRGNELRKTDVIAWVNRLLNIEEETCLRTNTVKQYTIHLFAHCKSIGVTLEEETHDEVKQLILNLQRARATRETSEVEQRGARAVLSHHVDFVMRRIPRGWGMRSHLCSIMSLAMCTGHRGVTLRSLTWGNLRWQGRDENGKALVSAKFTLTKGVMQNPLENTLDGVLEDGQTEGSAKNFPFHLQEWLREELDDPTASLEHDLQKMPSDRKVFPAASYSHHIKHAFWNAGFPQRISITLHSFRAGFLAECLLTALLAGKSWVDAWEYAARMLGWRTPCVDVMHAYLKGGIQRALISSRILMPGQRSLPEGVTVSEEQRNCIVSRGMLNVITWHEIDQAELVNGEMPAPSWTERCVGRFIETTVAKELRKLQMTSVDTKAELEAEVYKFLADIARSAGVSLSDEEEENDDDTNRNSSNHSYRKRRPPRKANKMLARKWLMAVTDHTHRPFVREQVAAAAAFVRKGPNRNLSPQEVQARRAAYEAEVQQLMEDATAAAPAARKRPDRRRTRVYWTDEETDVLMSALAKHKRNFSLISCSSLLHARTNSGCKDRLRSVTAQIFGPKNRDRVPLEEVVQAYFETQGTAIPDFTLDSAGAARWEARVRQIKANRAAASKRRQQRTQRNQQKEVNKRKARSTQRAVSPVATYGDDDEWTPDDDAEPDHDSSNDDDSSSDDDSFDEWADEDDDSCDGGNTNHEPRAGGVRAGRSNHPTDYASKSSANTGNGSSSGGSGRSSGGSGNSSGGSGSSSGGSNSSRGGNGTGGASDDSDDDDKRADKSYNHGGADTDTDTESDDDDDSDFEDHRRVGPPPRNAPRRHVRHTSVREDEIVDLTQPDESESDEHATPRQSRRPSRDQPLATASPRKHIEIAYDRQNDGNSSGTSSIDERCDSGDDLEFDTNPYGDRCEKWDVSDYDSDAYFDDPAPVKKSVLAHFARLGFQPTPAQLRMVESVTSALTQKRNCVVQSATGTGKTLAILLTVWHYQRLSKAWGDEFKVVVASRTHVQLEQLARVLKKAAPSLGRDFKAVVLGGRGR